MATQKFNGIQRFYKDKKANTIITSICFVLVGAFDMLPALFLSTIVNLLSYDKANFFGIILQKDDLLFITILFFVSIILFYIGSQQLRAYVRFKAVKYKDDLRTQMQNKIVSLNSKLTPKKTNGEIIDNIAHNITSVDKIYTTPISETLSPIVSSLFAIVYLFFINIWIAIIALVMIPISIVISQKMILSTQQINKNIKINQAINNDYYYDILNNFPIISLFNGHNKEVQYYNDIKNGLKESEHHLAKELNKFWLLMNIFRVATLISALTLAIVQTKNGVLEVGSLVLVFSYVNSSNRPIFSTNKAINEMVTGSVEISKVFDVIDSNIEQDTKPVEKIDEIQFQNITLSQENQILLHNINATFDNSKLNFVIGHNGSGKSTLLSLLYRQQNFDGKIFVNGKEIKKINFQDISVSPQQSLVFDRSVEYNLRYSTISKDLDIDLLSALNIDKKLLENSNSLSAKSMSGGEKRKLSLYRCLNKPAKLYN